MNRPTTYPDRSASHRHSDSVGVQTSILSFMVMTMFAAAVIVSSIITSKWRSAAAGAKTPFGSEQFPADLDFMANIGDFVLGTSWVDLVKNLVAVVFFIFMAHIVRPVLPFGRDKS